MAKEIVGQIKLQIPAGQANPAPPVGPALGQQGVNIMAFCKEFNARTQKQAGDILPVVITVFKDKSFTFITKQPPASSMIKKALNLASGSKEPNKIKVGVPISRPSKSIDWRSRFTSSRRRYGSKKVSLPRSFRVLPLPFGSSSNRCELRAGRRALATP